MTTNSSDNQIVTTPNLNLINENSNNDTDTSNLSKSQLKKIKKREKWLAQKPEKRYVILYNR